MVHIIQLLILKGVKIIKINDQSSTDFGKSMDFIRSIDILVINIYIYIYNF